MTKSLILSGLVGFGLAVSPVAYAEGPATPQKTPATDATVDQSYVVEKGDTLAAIAKEFFGDESKWTVIARANTIEEPAKLAVGTRLRIPKDTRVDPSSEKRTPAVEKRSRPSASPEGFIPGGAIYP